MKYQNCQFNKINSYNIKHYKKEGFLLIKNVLNKQDLKHIENSILKHLKKLKTKKIRFKN